MTHERPASNAVNGDYDGEVPEYATRDYEVFNGGISFALKQLASYLGVKQYSTSGGGTETLEGDTVEEISDILKAAGVGEAPAPAVPSVADINRFYDDDGKELTPDELADLVKQRAETVAAPASEGSDLPDEQGYWIRENGGWFIEVVQYETSLMYHSGKTVGSLDNLPRGGWSKTVPASENAKYARFDEAISWAWQCYDAIRDHFNDDGKLKGDGNWRLIALNKHAKELFEQIHKCIGCDARPKADDLATARETITRQAKEIEEAHRRIQNIIEVAGHLQPSDIRNAACWIVSPPHLEEPRPEEWEIFARIDQRNNEIDRVEKVINLCLEKHFGELRKSLTASQPSPDDTNLGRNTLTTPGSDYENKGDH